MIEVRALRVTYGRSLALDSLDLLIRPGVTGVYGQNGAGKSTLLRVLAGLLSPAEGSVTVDGSPLARDEETRRAIGYAGHDTGLYRHLTVGENLDLFALMYGAGRTRVATVLEQLKMTDRIDSRVAELSAGLKRRAAVARALLHEPRILLLDEPYANLDDDAAEALSGAVVAWRSENRYALIATHGAKRVKPFADAGIVLRDGRLVSYQVRTDA